MAKSMPARLLVVDQDARYGEWLKHHLGVLCPESPVSVLQITDFERWSEELSGRDCDVLMLAASFGSSPEDPKAQGLDLLRQLREKPHFPAVIAVAEDGNELTAVRAMQLGAVDYLPKRLLTPERLKTSVKLALRMIEKRVARRLANLQHSIDGESRSSVILPIKMAVTTDVAEAADAKAAVSLTKPARGKRGGDPESSVEISRNTDMRMFAEGRDGAEPGVAQAAGAAGKAEPVAAGEGESASSIAERALAKAESTRAKTEPTANEAEPAAQGTPQADPGTPKADSAASQPGPGAPKTEAPAAQAVQSTPPAETNTAPVPAARAPGGEFMSANFIPGYTIHATIGESEKAAVYVATSAARNENVALKVSKTLRDEAAGRQFLEREYTAIVAIRDPSVVQIHDYGVHAGYEYLVMEYLPRGDLKARMQQPLSELETLRYVAQIAAALQVVHHAGLLHRDLKPPNVMLRENDDVALIDFGLARALDGSTPYYMSPEQAMGEVLDARSDFYSLGIMYYEMLTGKKPYTGGSAMDVLQQHVNAPLPMLPKALVQHEPLLLKLLAKSREDRFASAEEILVAISARREADRNAREAEQVESSAA
jgi:DNA-binding response OmpR family regulator